MKFWRLLIMLTNSEINHLMNTINACYQEINRQGSENSLAFRALMSEMQGEDLTIMDAQTALIYSLNALERIKNQLAVEQENK